jgi:release factor glutamine methyltransferase
MKSLKDVLQLSTQFLQERNIERPRRLVEDLLASLLRCKRIDLYMQFDRPLEDAELAVLRQWLKRSAQHEPLEYITGEIDFFGCQLRVDRRALIPRPETELLVERVAQKMGTQKSVWDVCTGSGCIAIALKKRFPLVEVFASDISEEALSLAKENAIRNGVEISFLKGDLLSPFVGKKADIIICNPPYVTTGEFFNLDSSVRDFEPKIALVGGDDGLDFYRRLADEICPYLEPQGQLYLEIGYAQGEAVKKIFSSPAWVRSELIQDLSRKDRFFFLEKQ